VEVLSTASLVRDRVMDATASRITGIVGTDIIIFAVQRPTWDTLTVAAGITIRAGIVVVASYGVFSEDTAHIRIAGVVGTQLIIIADDCDTPATASA